MDKLISILIALTKACPKLLPGLLILAFANFVIALLLIFEIIFLLIKGL
jgi:hypothetical protein